MIAAIQDSLVSMVLASIVLLAAMFVERAVAHARSHRPLANRRFKRRYHIEHPLTGRTTAPARPPEPNTEQENTYERLPSHGPVHPHES